MRASTFLVALVLSASVVSGQTVSVTSNGADIATEATLGDIRSYSLTSSEKLTSIESRLINAADQNQVAKTQGDQVMFYASDTAPTATTAGYAQRPWVDLNGRLHIATEAAEDTASANADILSRIACIRDDTLDVRSGAEGDYEPCHTNANGALWSIDVNSAAMLTALQTIDNLATDPCSSTAKTPVVINISTATTTELTASLAGASNYYYVCSINIGPTAGAQNIAIVDDDTDNCASVTSGMAGGTTAATGWNAAANGGISLGNGLGTVMRTNGTNRVICAVTSAAVQTSGVMMVVAAP